MNCEIFHNVYKMILICYIYDKGGVGKFRISPVMRSFPTNKGMKEKKRYRISFRTQVIVSLHPITVNLGHGQIVIKSDNLHDAINGLLNKLFFELVGKGIESDLLEYTEVEIIEVYCNDKRMSEDYIDEVIDNSEDFRDYVSLYIGNYA